jgi:hypothetical protein
MHAMLKNMKDSNTAQPAASVFPNTIITVFGLTTALEKRISLDQSAHLYHIIIAMLNRIINYMHTYHVW